MTPEQIAESIRQQLAQKERDDLDQLGRAQTGCTTTAIDTNGRTFTRDEILEILNGNAVVPPSGEHR